MSIVDQFREKARKKLAEKNLFTNLLDYVESKTKVSKEYLFYGLLGFVVFCLMIDWTNFVCNLIGFIYPAYESIKAIESHNKEDDKRWLMYWCVYALFGILENFSDRLFFWIPFYSLTKCIFLIWLMMPGVNSGTNFIYNRIIKVFFIKHQPRIENTIGQARDAINNLSTDALNVINGAAQAAKVIKAN